MFSSMLPRQWRGFFLGDMAESVRSVATTSASQDFLLMVTVAGRSGQASAWKGL